MSKKVRESVLKVKDFGTSFFVPTDGLDELSANRFSVPTSQLLQPGDVVIIRSNGNPTLVGRSLFVARVSRPTTFSGFCIRFRPDAALIHPRFAAYVIRSPVSRQRFYAFGSGTGIQNLNQDVLGNLPVPLPPPREQRAIAHVLGILDDKIGLNSRMNQTLETSARALFKSWFVDFDPVRAKAEGRPRVDMDVEAALLPKEFVESELGPVPRGWKAEPLDRVADFRNGLALQNFPAVDGEPFYRVIKIAQLRAGIADASERASTRVPREYIIHDGDLIFSWSGSLIVRIWAGGVGALNQHLFKVTSSVYPRWFIRGWLLHHLPEFQAIASGKATTMGHIQRHHLTQAKVVLPPLEFLAAAGRVLGPLEDLVVKNDVQNRSLAEIRDALLPRLLSGELRLRDAQHSVEQVA